MSEKLTVAELMARNAKDGGHTRADRPRRRRNLEDGGVSVSELTGSIPVVSDEHLEDADGAEGAVDTATADAAAADIHPHQGGHELDYDDEVTDDVDDVDEPEDAVVDGEVVAEEIVEDAEDTEDTGDAEDTVEQADEPEDTFREADADETAVFARVDTPAEEEPADSAEPAAEEPETTVLPAAETDEPAGDQEATEPETSDAQADSDEIIEYEDDAISWPAMLGQAAVALVVGVVIFFGFTLLWDRLGTALVLVMAAVVTLVCVGVVHALLRHRDALILILAFIVGLVITLGPRLIMAV